MITKATKLLTTKPKMDSLEGQLKHKQPLYGASVCVDKPGCSQNAEGKQGGTQGTQWRLIENKV